MHKKIKNSRNNLLYFLDQLSENFEQLINVKSWVVLGYVSKEYLSMFPWDIFGSFEHLRRKSEFRYNIKCYMPLQTKLTIKLITETRYTKTYLEDNIQIIQKKYYILFKNLRNYRELLRVYNKLHIKGPLQISMRQVVFYVDVKKYIEKKYRLRSENVYFMYLRTGKCCLTTDDLNYDTLCKIKALE